MVNGVQRAALSAALCFASGLLPTPVAAQSLRDIKPSAPLVLKQQGSFFVGGRIVFSPSTGWDTIGLPQFSQGEITVDQMYVQFQVPMDVDRLPIVFVHGCCLSSKTWETTPDGRMGWFEYFTRKGFPTYLADQVGRARSGFDATPYNQVRAGQLPITDQAPMLMAGAPFVWQAFRFGPSLGVPWPDEQFPLNKIGELSKQAIPDLIMTTLVPRNPANLFPELGNPDSYLPTGIAMAKLAKDLGGAILVGHSESAGFPTQAAIKDPTGVRAIIQLETGCFANLTPAHIKILKKIPILIVEGDHYDTPRPPPECVTMRQQINAAGGDMTYLQLPSAGLFGNSHMFMQDKNNLKVADVLIKWIDKHVKRKGRDDDDDHHHH
jgi:hypothetical protein